MQNSNELCPVLFIPHGGGPLPLLGDLNHQTLVGFLKEITPDLGFPSSILIISAHWEEEIATITSGKNPPLIYDYYGFPDQAYAIEYPVVGNPELAEKIYDFLQADSIEAKLDDERGFDHGVFVPLKIMYPEANIPCMQLSLLNSLSSESHIKIGRALSKLRRENVLIIGSGFSFHNMKALMSGSSNEDHKNEQFEEWLIETCTNPGLSASERETRLIDWINAPFARYCHPREEHLLPLHICMGMCESAAKLAFEGFVAGKKTSAFMWQ